MPMVLLRAWDRVFKIKDALRNKQYKQEDTQELFCELFNDVQNIHEELAEYIDTLGWNRPAFYNNGDDDDEDCTIAITVEDLVSNPSEFEDECECDVPDCDDSQTTNFSTFSNPLFDDSTSSDDESSHEEVIHKMSFKTYSNPLFDLDEEIISSKFNPIHNEDLDSTPKNDHFDTDSYPFESLLNHDTLMISSLKIDSLLAEFFGELIFLESIPPRVDEAKLLDNYSLSLPVIESFCFDIPSFSRPPAKPPDGKTRILNIKMMGDISDQKVPTPRLMIIFASNQEKSPDLLSHRGLDIFQLSAKCPMMIHGKNIPILDVPIFHFYPLDQFKYGGNWVKLSDLKQALRRRHPMLIIVQYSRKCEDSCQRILSSKSSFPQLQLGIKYSNLID
uniref:Uncharacterized protein n=1 Tax=Tanacetum cinerariifolium TaxID=118510 RepID=A0A699L202_TANCI|nr:hypothetical protein [Tanacetum cinerariifolium]